MWAIIAAAILLTATVAQIWAADSTATPAERKDQNRARTIAALVREIHARLPAGWKVSYDEKTSILEIERSKPVYAKGSEMLDINGTASDSQDPAGDPAKSIKPIQFYLFFDIQPYALSSVELARFKAENVEIKKQLDALYNALEKMHMTQKFDDFIPRTDDQKKQMDAYKKLKASLHVIPDYRYRDISLVYHDADLGGEPYARIVDEAARKECEQVFKQVLSLFTKYPGGD